MTVIKMENLRTGTTVIGRSGYGGGHQITGRVIGIETSKWGTSAKIELDNGDTDYASAVYEHDPYFHAGNGWYLAAEMGGAE